MLEFSFCFEGKDHMCHAIIKYVSIEMTDGSEMTYVFYFRTV
jgi:hypothetical protein